MKTREIILENLTVIEAMNVLHNTDSDCFCEFNGAVFYKSDSIKDAYAKLKSIYGIYISVPELYS